jgi:hypothetical protein
MPKFIVQSRSSKYAKRVIPALGTKDIPTFQNMLVEALTTFSRMFERAGRLPFFYGFKAADIGSDKLMS